jgi:2',3'-cyclic-nucleotide 2'-phosphodiesterase/3'-nucleotidase
MRICIALAVIGFVLPSFPVALAREVKITVLATSDLHGNLLPYDYFTGREAQRGLAKIATLIRAERTRNPNTILLDCGDTIQGSPLEGYYQSAVTAGKAAGQKDPMMAAMNLLGYAAMTVGNHDFNFGLKNLERARSEAGFPWLSANTKTVAGSAVKPFAPYMIKTMDGVKVAVIGITTPSIPNWEKPENIAGYRFEDGVAAARTTVAELKAKDKPDLILVAAHSGLGRDAKSGKANPADLPGENMMFDLANSGVPIDAVAFGHTHLEVPELRLGNVLLTQPKNWGMSLSVIDFVLESTPGGWSVKQKSSRTVPVRAETPMASDIEKLAEPYHARAERNLNVRIAEASTELSTRESRIEDTAMMDAIQKVQLDAAKADVSLASAFRLDTRIPKGPVTVRQIAALYIYDNELYAIRGNGKMVREALENAARYYRECPEPSCSKGPLVNEEFPGFNLDMAEGVSYQIDLRRPIGQRIINLQFRGKPLADDQPLRIAVNSYRAGGSGGYTMFRGAEVLWRSYETIRDLMIRYYQAKGAIPTKPSENWELLPYSIRRILSIEILNMEETRATNR